MRLVSTAVRSALALTTAGVLLSIAPSATAGPGDARLELRRADGVLKAVATYDDASNRFCLKVVNGLPGAWATALNLPHPGAEPMSYLGYPLQDNGGDDQFTCQNKDRMGGAGHEGDPWFGMVVWGGTGGERLEGRWRSTF